MCIAGKGLSETVRDGVFPLYSENITLSCVSDCLNWKFPLFILSGGRSTRRADRHAQDLGEVLSSLPSLLLLREAEAVGERVESVDKFEGWCWRCHPLDSPSGSCILACEGIPSQRERRGGMIGSLGWAFPCPRP